MKLFFITFNHVNFVLEYNKIIQLNKKRNDTEQGQKLDELLELMLVILQNNLLQIGNATEGNNNEPQFLSPFYASKTKYCHFNATIEQF